jgi:hypothetical protein
MNINETKSRYRYLRERVTPNVLRVQVMIEAQDGDQEMVGQRFVVRAKGTDNEFDDLCYSLCAVPHNSGPGGTYARRPTMTRRLGVLVVDQQCGRDV